MKKKPDISGFVTPKNPNEFLDGGAAAAAEKTTPLAPVVTAPSIGAERITKTIRLRRDVEQRLKDEAYSKSKAKGKRVTESDLIEEALIKYLNM